MCGLVGLISKNQYGFTRDQQETFAQLLFIDMLRGQDSTGVFVVSNEGDAYVAKDALNSPQFMQTKEFDESMQRAFRNGSAMIGHNRKATRGNVTDENAHPFNVDNNIILVHNGTMRSDHKKHADVEVDSHAIAHLIHEKGNVKEALDSFTGAYALIWYDVRNATINMIRNDERPLWWMETPNSWIWSSEKEMLDFVTYRQKLKVVTEPTELTEHLLQQFKLENKQWVLSNEKVEVETHVYSTGWEGYEHGQWQFGGRPAWERFRDNEGSDEGANDRAMRPVPQTVLQMLPRPQQQQPVNHRSGGGSPDMEPIEFAGRKERERQLARNQNKIVTYREFQNVVIGRNIYPMDKWVTCCAFDYDYVNGVDSSDGFYLYATPIDNDSVLVRHYYSSKYLSEERMLQMSAGGYIYDLQLGQKSWSRLHGNEEDMNLRDDTEGVLVIRSLASRLVAKGEYDAATGHGRMH